MSRVARDLIFAVLLFPLLCAGQHQIENRPPPLGRAEGIQLGRALVADLLSQRPAEDSTNSGVLRIRDDDGNERTVPVRFAIFSTPTNWVSTYQAETGSKGSGAVRLTVIHSGEQPNQYLLAELSTSVATNSPGRILPAGQTMIPFATSDFWVADLGLQFLHWPQQRVLRKEMRHGQPCDVLESINSEPSAGGYSRVVSWIDTETGGILHADAYDAGGHLLKQFDPKTLKKVRGQRQLEEMEMRNLKTGSQTRIKFDL